MLVSIGLPVYNGLPYLRDAVSTILTQDIDLELIISDDNSVDGSLEFVQNLSDARMRVLTNKANGGIFANLNRCVAAARGQLFQVFSQDDLMKPGYLASQVRSLQSHPDAGLVYGTPDYIDENGNPIPTFTHDDTPEVIDRDVYLWIASHYGALPASISSIMIPMKTFDVVGQFDARYRVAGDVDFYNRVAERFNIIRNKDVLHSVRSHRRMTSALSSAGPLYLGEERQLDGWYRERWSKEEYQKIKRFRAATRGRYHLGWIRRLLLGGRLREAVAALSQLGRLYPLHWIIGGRVHDLVWPNIKPRPLLRPPGPRTEATGGRENQR